MIMTKFWLYFFSCILFISTHFSGLCQTDTTDVVPVETDSIRGKFADDFLVVDSVPQNLQLDTIPIANTIVDTLVIKYDIAESGQDSLDITPDDFFLKKLDQELSQCYENYFCFSADTSLLNYLNFSPDEIPKYSPDIMRERMKSLDELTPLPLPYNNLVQSYINTYAVRNRGTISRVLGLSHLYFPLFEQVLSKYDIPLEMKYLAVVESALRNEAKSPVGAVGLWQFMVPTGRYYGLEINSYIDERRDAFKSTEAACQYLSFLYDKYDDWYLALAAYNSGPGNVNKAIRRSGGKKDYWKIRSYLPRETRGYVPAFIAVNYIMNFASEHNIYPIEPIATYFNLDTIHVSKKLRFDQIMAFTHVSEEELLYLNPTFFRGVIPHDGKVHNLYLPKTSIGEFLVNEEKIYNYKKDKEPVIDNHYISSYTAATPTGQKITYRVRSGDVIGVIADKHGVRLSQLKAWNNLRSNRIYPGQKLTLYVDKNLEKKRQEKKKAAAPDYSKYIYYTVKEGDTLWDIAKLFDGVSSKDIEQLNREINVRRLRKGQKIKIQAI